MITKTDIEKFVEKSISVLYDNGTHEKANQNGKLVGVSDSALELDPRNNKYKIEAVVIPLSRVVSVWALGDGQ